MAEHPIIFSTEMVRAILTCAQCGTITIEIKCPKCGSLERRKAQTRRIIKPQPKFEFGTHPAFYPNKENCYTATSYDIDKPRTYTLGKCLYGKVGDTLWVRERILLKREQDTPYFDTLYCADNTHLDNLHELDDWFESYNGWYDSGKNEQIIPSIHMHKEAARIFLEITNIRVERVQDISESNIISEGCPEFTSLTGIDELYAARMWWWNELWNSINAKRGYGWDENPYVWVVEFKRTTFNSESS